MKCRVCEGSGFLPNEPTTCSECEGSGVLCMNCGAAMERNKETCDWCEYRGTCEECGCDCPPDDTICNGCYEELKEYQVCNS